MPRPRPQDRRGARGLLRLEEGEAAQVDRIGDEPYYVVLDVDFRRYVEAEIIDRQVLSCCLSNT
jgi:hypothetical protein